MPAVLVLFFPALDGCQYIDKFCYFQCIMMLLKRLPYDIVNYSLMDFMSKCCHLCHSLAALWNQSSMHYVKDRLDRACICCPVVLTLRLTAEMTCCAMLHIVFRLIYVLNF